eukprot:COSAG01_NODE_2639_length_7326_cov_15.912550_6_plen_76_part_00
MDSNSFLSLSGVPARLPLPRELLPVVRVPQGAPAPPTVGRADPTGPVGVWYDAVIRCQIAVHSHIAHQRVLIRAW